MVCAVVGLYAPEPGEYIGGKHRDTRTSSNAGECFLVTGFAVGKPIPANNNGDQTNTSWLPKELQRDDDGFVYTGRDVPDLPVWSEDRPPYLL